MFLHRFSYHPGSDRSVGGEFIMVALRSIFYIVLSLLLLIVPVGRAETAPALGLTAEFTQNAKCPVFKNGETVEISVTVRGTRTGEDTLLWNAADWMGRVIDSGKITVPSGAADWSCLLKPKSLGVGYFTMSLRLEKSGVTLPALGSRPAGILSYAILPAIEPLPLAHNDDSRFGAQGVSAVQGDNPYSLYPLVGMKWAYRDRRLFDLAPKSLEQYQPVLDPAKAREAAMQEGYTGMSVFVDAHSLPIWLTQFPAGSTPEKWHPSATLNFQSYPPNDYAQYEAFIGKIAAEQAVFKKAALPGQAHNYYEIHWEPDWHWKGTDEEFIQMYEHARAAIKRNDPDGLLLGANYGVLAEGNKRLERLFKKGLGKHLDGIVTHTYYLPMLRRSPEQAGIVEDMRKLTAMTMEYISPEAPIINSEWGVSCPDYFGVSPQKDLSVLNREAAWFLRGHLIALGEGARTTFFFYLVDHDVFGLFFNLDFPRSRFKPERVAPKPVFSAVATMTRLLEGTRNIGRVDYLGKNVLGYIFSRQGENIAAIWSTDEKERTVIFPVGADKVEVRDLMGNRTEIATKNGALTLKIGAIPLYVSGISAQALPALSAKWAPSTLIAGASENAKTEGVSRYEIYTGENVATCGQSGSLFLPLQTPPGRWLLVAVDAKGKWLGSQYLTVTPSVEIQCDPKKIGVRAATDASQLTVRLKNRSDKKSSGSVTVLGLNNEELKRAAVTIPPRAEVETVLALPKISRLAATAGNTLQIRYRGEDGTQAEEPVEVELGYSIARLTKALTIDGDLSEWPLESFQTVDTGEAVKVNGSDWQGAADLSFRYAIRYDDAALYIAIRDRDQSFCQLNEAAKAWMGDSIQIGVGIGRRGAEWKSSVSYCFATDSRTQKGKVYRHHGTDQLPACEVALGKIRMGFKRVGDENLYEIAIPWRELDRSLQGPPVDRLIGVGLLVNDADFEPNQTTPGVRKAMEALGGMANLKPADFGLGVLD